MEDPAHTALVALGNSLGDDIDETVLEYLCSVLAEDPESCLEDVVELLASACAAFGRLPAEQQTEHVLALLAEVASSAAAPCAVHVAALPPASLSSGTGAELVAFQLAQLSCCSEPRPTDGNSRGDLETSTSSHTGPDMQPEVQELLALCPSGIQPAFIVHVLRDLNGCDPQAAADWILDCSDIAKREQAWLDRQRDQEQDRERQKQAILDRFDLQAVPDVPANGSRRDRALDSWGRDKRAAQQVPQVRYRDGQCHHTKSKYIVEQVKEDWDGGSTGKVYTKGKRGKGFH